MTPMPTVIHTGTPPPTNGLKFIKTQNILKLLIERLTCTKDYKHHKKLFKEFIDKKDRGPYQPINYYLYYDIDFNKFGIASEYDITFNCIVLSKAVVPSKHDKKSEKSVIDYQFEWMPKL